jgi:methylase of polypeptide subunit release factors
LILEIGTDQGADLLRLLEQTGGFGGLEIIPDYAGRGRAMIARKGRQ